MSPISDRILKAREHLRCAFEIINELGPELEEPERGALIGTMGARWELSRLIRQLGNVATMVGTGS